jgi:hypothetical protein
VRRPRKVTVAGRRPSSRAEPLDALALLQAAVTVLVAIAIGVGALLASQAGSRRQEAVRQEIKRSAATIEDVRFVYGDEAPLAYRVAVARALTEEMRAAARSAGPDGSAAAVEAVVQEQVAFRLASGQDGTGSLAEGNRYRTPEGGYDVGRRLADVRAANPELVALDPDAAQAAADGFGRAASTATAATGVLVAAYLVVALMRGLRGRRRRGRGAATVGAEPDIGLIPQPWAAEPTRRQATTVALIAWILLTVLSGPQIYFADQEQRAQSLAARDAALITTSIAASSLRQTFMIETSRSIVLANIGSLARELGELDVSAATARSQQLIADAERAAVPRMSAIAGSMTRPPSAADGVDLATRSVIASTPADWTALQTEQSRQATLADHAGSRADRIVIALLLAGLATSLSAVAAATASPPLPVLWTAIAILLGAATVTATTLFI